VSVPADVAEWFLREHYGTLVPWSELVPERLLDPERLCAAVLHVTSRRHGPLVALNTEDPRLHEVDWRDFLEQEVVPRVQRLREHGPEPDGWRTVSPDGPWQLWLFQAELPLLD
jgi:hypothetical protein